MFFLWFVLVFKQGCGRKALQSRQASEPENLIRGKRKLVITLHGEIVDQCFILLMKFRQQQCNVSYSCFMLLELVKSCNQLSVLMGENFSM